jgi:uncharacterized phage-associated protein
VTRNRRLFTDDIQAWSHGPVVPDVYHEYKNFRSASIKLPGVDPFTWKDVYSATKDFLSQVWNTAGGFSTGHLHNMTHKEPPWKNHWTPDGCGVVIPT